MRVLVIGGSGRTGQLVIKELLERKYTVTALARKPDSIAPQAGLTIVLGTPTSATDIEKSFIATPDIPQAVIVALASTRTSDNPWAAPTSPPNLLADTNTNLVAAMKMYNVRRIVSLSAIGVGDSWSNLICFMRWVFSHSNIAIGYADHNQVDKQLKESGLDYVLVRPNRLTEGGKLPVRVFGNDGAGIGGFSGISRESVAGFLVDAVEGEEWVRMTPVIAN